MKSPAFSAFVESATKRTFLSLPILAKVLFLDRCRDTVHMVELEVARKHMTRRTPFEMKAHRVGDGVRHGDKLHAQIPT